MICKEKIKSWSGPRDTLTLGQWPWCGLSELSVGILSVEIMSIKKMPLKQALRLMKSSCSVKSKHTK